MFRYRSATTGNTHCTGTQYAYTGTGHRYRYGVTVRNGIAYNNPSPLKTTLHSTHNGPGYAQTIRSEIQSCSCSYSATVLAVVENGMKVKYTVHLHTTSLTVPRTHIAFDSARDKMRFVLVQRLRSTTAEYWSGLCD